MYLVKIELARIQTFLFASPRLRAILGANSLLGKVIRLDLVELAQQCGAQACSSVKELPLAQENDPLSQALSLKNINKAQLLIDNPQQVYEQTGVLIRDGGHFRATFTTQELAEEFGRKALDLIAQQLPSLRAECHVQDLTSPNQNNQEEIGTNVLSTEPSELPFNHPSWQVCQRTGDRPASKQVRHESSKTYISKEQQALESRGKKYRQEPTDIISLMDSLLGQNQASSQTFEDISSDGYLALIHADGNSVGARFSAWRDQGPKNNLASEVHAEKFFHSMRVAVRIALNNALQSVFGSLEATKHQVLMLGGDDLLLACSAEYAFPFICAYAKELENLPLIDNKPLTIGAGIAIAKSKFPFHRLHECAEELASSAKILFRADEELGSVADWHISSQSWIDNPLAERKALYNGKPIIGIQRPYSLTQKREDIAIPSLTSLLDSSNQVAQSLFSKQDDQETAARSQLKALKDTLEQANPFVVELAWEELPASTKNTLNKAQITSWKLDTESENQPITLSILGDLIDLIELNTLSTSKTIKQEKSQGYEDATF